MRKVVGGYTQALQKEKEIKLGDVMYEIVVLEMETGEGKETIV